MKNVAKVLAAAICMFAINIPVGFCQGDDYLTPRGAPGSEITRMKTLNQVEPRQVISSLPYSITNPGSYYLAASVKGVANSNGITISSDDVKLDLSGFALNGEMNSLNAIEVTPPVRHNITIRNGVVRGWDKYGIQAMNAQDCTLESVKAYMNGYMGIAAGENSLLTDCLAYGNGSKFVAGPPPSLAEDDGIHVGAYSTVKDCKSRNNLVAGIYASMSSRVSSSTASQNGANGVFAEDYCTVSDCTVAGNKRGGITLLNKCRAACNTSCDNTNSVDHQGSGILVQGSNNRIENNNVAGNDYGINVLATSSNNLVTCNSASGNTVAYQMSQEDRMGQVVTPSNGMYSNSNPWANFVF